MTTHTVDTLMALADALEDAAADNAREWLPPSSLATLIAARNNLRTALTEALAPQAVPEWLPIESAPKDGTLVVLYSPNGPDDWPDSFKVTFDYFCKDYENWFHHSDAHEHYMAVGGSNACGQDAVCTGPSEKAPYTHWMPLPSVPNGAV